MEFWIIYICWSIEQVLLFVTVLACCATTTLIILFHLVRLTYKSYFFSQRTIFFSHNKSTNSTFSYSLSAKRTGQWSAAWRMGASESSASKSAAPDNWMEWGKVMLLGLWTAHSHHKWTKRLFGSLQLLRI